MTLETMPRQTIVDLLRVIHTYGLDADDAMTLCLTLRGLARDPETQDEAIGRAAEDIARAFDAYHHWLRPETRERGFSYDGMEETAIAFDGDQ